MYRIKDEPEKLERFLEMAWEPERDPVSTEVFQLTR